MDLQLFLISFVEFNIDINALELGIPDFVTDVLEW